MLKGLAEPPSAQVSQPLALLSQLLEQLVFLGHRCALLLGSADQDGALRCESSSCCSRAQVLFLGSFQSAEEVEVLALKRGWGQRSPCTWLQGGVEVGDADGESEDVVTWKTLQTPRVSNGPCPSTVCIGSQRLGSRGAHPPGWLTEGYRNIILCWPLLRNPSGSSMQRTLLLRFVS